QSGHGETDAFQASDFPFGRRYDRLVAITRSGTTTETVDVMREVREHTPVTLFTADGAQPATDVATDAVVLDFADEKSVVQTRFATTALSLFRASLGIDLAPAIADAERTLVEDLPEGVATRRQFTFLGTGWTVGLANEAAVKMREASLSWTEAYPAMEYRHGPMSITDESSVVWILGTPPSGLVEEIRRFGAIVVSEPDRDPVAELIRIQRLAVHIGLDKGLDPDSPRNLSRSVVLSDA
ncbi:MAG TPA: sugar isomerase, partial [Actinopolymorphaceae bacterium]